MKRLFMCIMTVSALLTLTPTQTMAAEETNPVSVPVAKITDTERNDALVKRLNEINAMDKSAMSASEKRELRKEVRSMKREVKDGSGGLYISVGAAILIVLLLILLL